MTKRYLVLLWAGVMIAGVTGMAQAIPVQWPANGHYYEAIAFPSGITWSEAKTYAETLVYMGMKGHLATITSMAENSFIVNNLGGPDVLNTFFLGGFQPPGSPEPAGNWQWVTGENWSFTNWHSDAPNNFYSGGGTIPLPYGISEEVLHFWGHNGTWNDVPLASGWTGLIVEYESLTPGCTYSISPDDANIEWEGGSGSVSVTTQSNCQWSASATPESWDWLGISSGTGGTGNGIVEWYALANNNISSRSGYLMIAGQPFIVTQVGVGPDLTGSWTVPLSQTCRPAGQSYRCSLKGTFTVVNIGNKDAPYTVIRFYLSDNPGYEDDDIQLKYVSAGKLKTGKSKAINLSLNLAKGQTAKGKYIIAVIDEDDLVIETDEDNNSVAYGPIQ